MAILLLRNNEFQSRNDSLADVALLHNSNDALRSLNYSKFGRECLMSVSALRSARTLQAVAVAATLGGVIKDAQAGDFPSEGGQWKRPALSEDFGPTSRTAGGSAEELYKRDPCLDPDTKKPLTENGFTWLDGRTEKTPNGECHAARVRVSKKERRDGVRVGVVAAHGDWSPGTMDRFAPNLHLTFIEALRPGYCDPDSKLCSSGKQSDNYNGGQPIANRTPDVADSYRGLIQNIRTHGRFDVIIIFGSSGGNNLLANAATHGNADGGFFLSTTCDDKIWINTSQEQSNVRFKLQGDFNTNVDQMDAIPSLDPNFVSLIMTGGRDNNTHTDLGRMCYEATTARGLEAHFLSPTWLAHGAGFGSLRDKGREEELKTARKEINDAWEILVESVVAKFKDRRRNQHATK